MINSWYAIQYFTNIHIVSIVTWSGTTCSRSLNIVQCPSRLNQKKSVWQLWPKHLHHLNYYYYSIMMSPVHLKCNPVDFSLSMQKEETKAEGGNLNGSLNYKECFLFTEKTRQRHILWTIQFILKLLFEAASMSTWPQNLQGNCAFFCI